ncbi:MAG TPA: NAD(P)H-hydrate dehydratase [Pirellulales bacterium]|jgi:NAD(P)H-hydrate epimerase|nr:NAD(P)H-hydrate dehydratase [Pirellulales bacterium]
MTEQQPSESPLPQLPPRRADSHKYDFGRALLVGGSRGMTGAISMSGMAALRCGAGLVQVAVPACCQAWVAPIEPSFMTIGLPCDDDGRISSAARPQLISLAAGATSIGIGPGLGQSPGLAAMVAWLFASIPQPMVCDADALNAISRRPDLLGQQAGPRILTPHPGEFRRLVPGDKHAPREQLEQEAQTLAKQTGVVVVLKGHRTLITDGQQSAHNTTGNPGMATGGTGDVLTGMITALVGQGLSPFDAARLGVYLHGLAGDLAAAELGQVSMIGSDLIRFLPHAFQRHAGHS